MNEHVEALERRLIGLFESRAQEFRTYSNEDPSNEAVTSQLACLYAELVEVMRS
jgi:hypothetical protein